MTGSTTANSNGVVTEQVAEDVARASAQRAENQRELRKLHPANRFRTMFGQPLIGESINRNVDGTDEAATPGIWCPDCDRGTDCLNYGEGKWKCTVCDMIFQR